MESGICRTGNQLPIPGLQMFPFPTSSQSKRREERGDVHVFAARWGQFSYSTPYGGDSSSGRGRECLQEGVPDSKSALKLDGPGCPITLRLGGVKSRPSRCGSAAAGSAWHHGRGRVSDLHKRPAAHPLALPRSAGCPPLERRGRRTEACRAWTATCPGSRYKRVDRSALLAVLVHGRSQSNRLRGFLQFEHEG